MKVLFWRDQRGVASLFARANVSAGLLGLCLLMFSTFAHAAGCQPQSITVASGGTVVTDLSNCTVSGINGYQSPPQHGANDSRNNNGTGLVYYTNNGDSSATDSFSVIDADDNSVIPFSVTVQQVGPSITTTTLPDLVVGAAYSLTLTASGGSTPYSWSLTGGALPAGLTLSTAGVVSGTPTQAGSFSPVFTVTDNANRTASRTIAVNVAASTLAITPTTLPNGVAGTGYSQALGTNGGTAPYTYAVSGGTPPPGITVSNTGSVSGTPTTPGTYSFTVRSTDSSTGTGAPFSTTRNYSVTVDAPTITVAPATLPNPTVGAGYSQTISASGGTAPYTFAITAGALPAGMSLTGGGTLSGTPSSAGTFNFTITATDNGGFTGSRAYTITVAAPTITVSPTSLPNANAGQAYSTTLTANGGTPAYTYAVTSGSLPSGISLSPTGVISGTSTVAGNFTFTVTATDSSTGSGAPFTGARTYTLTVAAPTVVVGPTTLPNPTVGVAYSQNVVASGGTAPYTFAVTAGVTPDGLTLTTAGVLSGTPGAAGTFNFTVTATDSNGFTGNRAYTVTVAAPTITVAPTSLPNAVAGQAYSTTLSAAGGTAPYSFAVTAGSLPSGISLAPTGVLSGTSTVAGTFNFTVSATDSSSGAGAPFSGSRAYALTVGAPAVVIAPATLPNPTVGTAYSQTVTASGGTAPYTFAITAGATPSGLTLSTSGVLSGTPTAAGTFNITITATDGNGFTGARAYTVAASGPTIIIAPTTLPNGSAGQAYLSTLMASGGTAPYTYVVTAGSLPTGLVLSPTGVLSGTSTAAGTFNFTVSATDSSSGAGAPYSGSQAYVLVVAAPTMTLPATTLPVGTAGQTYSATINAATGGIAPYTYTLSAGSLPNGVTVSSTTGALNGTPMVAGNFAFTLTATDSTSGTPGQVSQSYNLSIGAPTLAIAPATFAAGKTGAAYSQALSTSGGLAPYSYSVSAGTLPGGLALSAGGVLSGTPNAAGSFSFTVSVTDAGGFTAARAYTIDIATSVPPPVAVNDSGATLVDTALTLAVAENDTGSVDSIAVTTAPTHGSAAVSGLQVIYRPIAGYIGADTFTYSANGVGGTSSPATVTISVNARPIAVSATAAAVPGVGAQVDLTRNAVGGPFVAAAVVAVLPSSAGSASIMRVGGGTASRASGPSPAAISDSSSFTLTFTPNPAFSGQATVRFTLTNAYATSAAADIIFTVAPRRDPTLDAEVRGLIDAQSESTRRFARTQIDNFQRRLEATHRGGSNFSNGLRFQPNSSCLPADQALDGDPCAVATDQATENNSADQPTPKRSSLPADDLGFWASGTIRSGNLNKQSGRSGVDFQSDGLSAGADYRLDSSWAVGAGIGWGRDDSDVGRNGSQSRATAYTMAVYASFHAGQAFFLDTLVGYQLLDYDLRRYVTDDASLATGARSGNQWIASLSTGADLQRGEMQLTPYARLDVARASLDNYSEAGNAPFALHYEDMDVATTTGNMGARLEWRHQATWGWVTPQLRVEYQRDFQGRGASSLRYADLIDGPFYTTGLSRFDRNRVMLGVGATFLTGEGLSTRVEYRGIADGDSSKDQSLMLSVEKQY